MLDTYENTTEESLNRLEKRYHMENLFLEAVSQGNIEKCEKMLLSYSFNSSYQKRNPNPIRDMKNYTIIFNTLLRKSAEYGSVHPFYIDKISSDFALKIEALNTLEEGEILQRKMVETYCEIVNTHSAKNYSPLIQKLITKIDADISSDLSLSAQAKELNVNASYLSNVFKKEIGTTLTDYVSKKRIEYAKKILASTNLQIQSIAQTCGILDLNYFTKLFKKYTGTTPTKYRESVNEQQKTAKETSQK